MASDELLMVVVLIVGIVVVAIVHMLRRRLQAQRRIARDAMVARLAQRFGDGDAFVAFAQSPDGRALLENEYSPAAMAHRVLGLVQFGIVACAIGVVPTGATTTPAAPSGCPATTGASGTTAALIADRFE